MLTNEAKLLLDKLSDAPISAEARSRVSDWLSTPGMPARVIESIEDLMSRELWGELEHRFFKDLAFGTGGMRSRTLGREIARHEGPDLFPGVGSAMLNDFNIARATLALYQYAKTLDDAPKLVIAHDVRYFSSTFTQLAAHVWQKQGGEVFVFDGPRSTPQLSFTVRELGATFGIVITASHNPYHDNGYKVYGSDGAQIVAPHDREIEAAFRATKLEEVIPLVSMEGTSAESVSEAVEQKYFDILKRGGRCDGLSVIYSPLHGTGRVAIPEVLESLGAKVIMPKNQIDFDGAFSTVVSPNPESPEAYTHAIALANEQGVDAVFVTDPDSDRMGVAVRNPQGEFTLLSGNQIGALLLDSALSAQEGLSERSRVVKTFVTSPLLDAIAKSYGVLSVNTLTGFKWIGAKIKSYKDSGKAFVFGAEESFGYLGTDEVRDKDANGAVIGFCQLLSRLRDEVKSVLEYLDDLYEKHGYFGEDLLNLFAEGPSGVEKIQAILSATRDAAKKGSIAGYSVQGFKDFLHDDVLDEEGERVPKQNFLTIELGEGLSFAVRASGTEPKIKFYLFVHGTRETAVGSMKALRRALEDFAKQAGGLE